MDEVYIILLRYHYLTELYDQLIGGVYDGKMHVLVSSRQLAQSNGYAMRLRRRLQIPSELFKTRENHIISNKSFEQLEAEYNKLIPTPKEIKPYFKEGLR